MLACAESLPSSLATTALDKQRNRGENVINCLGCIRSLDTSVLDALALGGDVNGSSLDDFMIGDPDHGGQDAGGKLSHSLDSTQRNGALCAD